MLAHSLYATIQKLNKENCRDNKKKANLVFSIESSGLKVSVACKAKNFNAIPGPTANQSFFIFTQIIDQITIFISDTVRTFSHDFYR